MLEESAMDKKPAPAPSSVAKGCGSNGSQEKKHRGGGFAKRSNGGNGQSRQFDGGYGRKPLPQKTKALDKRPRSRGGYSENAKGRSEIAKEDRDVEFFSSAQPGSKKHNLNHLLNFTLAPREGDTALGGRGFNSGGLPAWRRRQKWGHSKVKYNKEQFLQANCQFVVQDSGDYTVHAANPDTLVDWSLVEQIRIFGHEVPSCPICLYPPTAAKMTRCGHIYCWSCILHYLALSDKPWRKCPICDEAIHNSDLKSVVVLETHQFSAGDEVSMKLMRRERGSVLAMPRAHWQSAAGKPFCEKDVADPQFMKLLSVSPQETLDSIVSRERTALETQYAVEKQYSESCFIQSALTHLEQREAALRMRQSPPATKPKPVGEEAEEEENEEEKGLEGKPVVFGEKAIVEYASAFDDQVANPDVTFDLSDEADNSPGEPMEEVSADVDGAGATEEVSADVDGAGATEEVDADVDGAGATEEVDADVDGAGATEEVDADVDGAGSFDGSPPPEFNVADIPVVPSSVCLGSLVVEAEGATEQRAEPSRGNVPKDNFYFYQAADGQHIYLHPINVRCLVREYGSLERCPDEITAKIVELDRFSMNEDVRQRLRYLQHLPLTCEFQLAELHLRSPLVSRRTLEFFADDLHRRTQERQRRARDERRRESALRERADARMGRYPSARVSLTSRRDFPEYNATGLAEDCFPPVVCMSPPSAGLSVSPGQPTVSTSPGSNVSSDGGVPSFAQMLRAGEKKADQWPAAKTTVAGERAWPVEGAAGYDDDGGEYAAPEYQSSYADAIALALEKLEVSKQSVGADVAAAPSSGGKKKRGKKKQVTLFSTSMACSKK